MSTFSAKIQLPRQIINPVSWIVPFHHSAPTSDPLLQPGLWQLQGHTSGFSWGTLHSHTPSESLTATFFPLALCSGWQQAGFASNATTPNLGCWSTSQEGQEGNGTSGLLGSLLCHCRDGPVTFVILRPGESFMALSLSSHWQGKRKELLLRPPPNSVFFFAASCSQTIVSAWAKPDACYSDFFFPKKTFIAALCKWHWGYLRLSLLNPWAWLGMGCSDFTRSWQWGTTLLEKSRWTWTSAENLNTFIKITFRNVSARCVSFLLHLAPECLWLFHLGCVVAVGFWLYVISAVSVATDFDVILINVMVLMLMLA